MSGRGHRVLARFGGLLVPWGLFAIFCAMAAYADDGALAFAVKAAYIPKFVPFVAWPAGTFAATDGTVHVCVGGRGPFGDLLERAAGHQIVDGHPVVVLQLPVVARNSGCAVLFAAGSAEQPVADMLAAVRATPVLTLTDEATDPRGRGIINFVVSDNRVRFEIDEAEASRNGLTISSKLLSLAVRVLDGK